MLSTKQKQQNELTIKDLDFFNIKEAFKSFLKTTTDFKDYNLEGSNISVFLDLLSYNTYWNSQYLNLLLNETFLDSAIQRSSIVSATKPIGFIPNSYKSAKYIGIVKITANVTDTRSQISIPKYSKFSSSGLYFYNTEVIILNKIGNEFISDISIFYEGKKRVHRFIVDNPETQFAIPYKQIDISSLEVRLFPTLSSYENQKLEDDPFRYYTQCEKLLDIDSESQIYFIQENIDGFYSLTFGDGILGKQIYTDNIIETTFIESSGSSGNDATNLVFLETDLGDSVIANYYSSNHISISTIDDVLVSFGGSENQDIESIRKYAPYHFEAQDRIVSENDYEYFIRQYLPNIDVLRIWGGEKNNPPRYGTIFSMIKPKGKEKLNSLEKYILINKIKEKSILNFGFDIKDPNILYLVLSLTIKINYSYIRDISLFDKKIKNLLDIISENYTGESFRTSELSYELKKYSQYIKSVNTDIKIKKQIEFTINSLETKEINYNNKIVAGSLYSSENFSLINTEFSDTITERIIDDGNGNIIYYSYSSLTQEENTKKIGTIDYDIGNIKLENIVVLSYENDETQYISFYVIPTNEDIYSDQESIFVFDSSLIERNYEQDVAR